MGTELRLIKDGKVLFNLSIPTNETRGRREKLEVDEDSLERLANIYSIVSNERRLRLLIELARRGEMRFSDMLEISVNPKTVSESIGPMLEEGIVLHGGRGSCYRPSDMGTILAFTMSAGLGRLLAAFEEETEDEDDE